MSTLENYKHQKRLDPEPSGEGGQGLNYNFRSIADHDPNFVENGFGIEDVDGWAAYADAAGATPVDGTGGSPTTTVTRTTSAPLIGDASILLTKPASDVQGEGCGIRLRARSRSRRRQYTRDQTKSCWSRAARRRSTGSRARSSDGSSSRQGA